MGPVSAKPLPRPPKVTVACLFVGLTCAFLVLSIASTLSDWGSIELQEQVADALDGPLGGTDVSVATVLDWLRWGLTFFAAVAAAGVVLAVYAARGHQGSRIALTVLAVLMALFFVAGGIIGLLPAAFAIGCAFYLWSPEARAWFDAKNGRAPRTSTPEPARPDPFAAPPAGAPPVAPGVQQGVQQGAPQPVPYVPHAYPGPRRPARPSSVVAAGVVTLSAAGVVAAVCGLNALLYLLSPDEYVQLLRDQPLTDDSVDELGVSVETLARWLFVGCGVLTALSLLGMLAGALVLARVRAGRVLALVLAVVTVPVGLAVVPVGWPWAVAAGLVVWWLTRPDAKSWLSSR